MNVSIPQGLRRLAFAMGALFLLFSGQAEARTEISALDFSAGRAPFAIRVGDVLYPYTVNSLFVLPGEAVSFEATGENLPELSASATSGTLHGGEAWRWTWTAPQEAGVSEIHVSTTTGDPSVILNVFTMVPFERLKRDHLNGYRIGPYPSGAVALVGAYHTPRGFVEVTPENRETLLSPHFTLEQFLCKQPGSFPKYVILQERLIQKLELILEKFNESGRYARTLHVMSGYRTPYYNKAIGNVKLSRHQYGDAADIYIDENGDGQMDDLNRDGKIDFHDARVLSAIADEIDGGSLTASLLGGLAVYKRNEAHGPFVHVDARGTRARWGS